MSKAEDIARAAGQRAREQEDAADAERAEQARKNREAMPQTAAILGAFKDRFGPGTRLRFASEGGLELGRRGPPGVPITLPCMLLRKRP